MIFEIVFWVIATPIILIVVSVVWLGVLAMIGNWICGGSRRD